MKPLQVLMMGTTSITHHVRIGHVRSLNCENDDADCVMGFKNVSTSNSTSIVDNTKLVPNTSINGPEYIIIFILSIVLILMLVGVKVCSILYNRRRNSMTVQDEENNSTIAITSTVVDPNTRIKNKMELKEQRYLSIEDSLVNIYVIEHSNCSNLCCTDTKTSDNNDVSDDKKYVSDQLQSNSSLQTELDDIYDTPCCSICLDPFNVGDIISVSPMIDSVQCKHVFHHSCIKEWLLKHDTCPTCRTLFLSRLIQRTSSSLSAVDDSYPNKPRFSSIPMRSHDCSNPSFFYCLDHGLTRIPVSSLTFNQSIPTKSELKSLRRISAQPSLHGKQCSVTLMHGETETDDQ